MGKSNPQEIAQLKADRDKWKKEAERFKTELAQAKEAQKKLTQKIAEEMRPVFVAPTQPEIDENTFHAEGPDDVRALAKKIREGLEKPLQGDNRVSEAFPALPDLNDSACALLEGNKSYHKIQSELPPEDDAKSEPVAEEDQDDEVPELAFDDEDDEFLGKRDAKENLEAGAKRKYVNIMPTPANVDSRFAFFKTRQGRQEKIKAVNETLSNTGELLKSINQRLTNQFKAANNKIQAEYNTAHAEAQRLRNEQAQANQQSLQEFQQMCQQATALQQTAETKYQEMVAAMQAMQQAIQQRAELIEKHFEDDQAKKYEWAAKCKRAEAEANVKLQALEGLKATHQKNSEIYTTVTNRYETVAQVFKEKLENLDNEVETRSTNLITGCKSMYEEFKNDFKELRTEVETLRGQRVKKTKMGLVDQAAALQATEQQKLAELEICRAGAKRFGAILKQLGELGFDDSSTLRG